MTWFSLICLLAVFSSAVARSTYGSYSSPALSMSNDQTMMSRTIPSSSSPKQYFDQYDSRAMLFNEQTETQADLLCRGQQPETVIPLESGIRYVVCTEEGKGLEQKCPKGLLYHTESRRCERKLAPLSNPCLSQPCLNGGQCLAKDVTTFQCQCAAGFDGSHCELDAQICQTQQPCGQAMGTKCQSFRPNAALQFACIHQNGLAYGLSAQQIQPNPCKGVDGTQPLAMSEKGFIMCDTGRMFVESCPGGTIWEDLTSACVWPDMRGIQLSALAKEQIRQPAYGQSYEQKSYGYQQTQMNDQSAYGYERQQPATMAKARLLDQPANGYQQSQVADQPKYSYQQATPTMDQSRFAGQMQFQQRMM